ncbi:hypothetical protein V8E55_008465 [Tylopilus felleus]
MMLPALLTLLLSFQWAAGDDARIPRKYNSASTSSHVLNELLAPISPKFVLRQSGGCPSGYQVCPNFPDECAPVGNFCCTDTYNCPDNTTCFGVDQ